MDFTQILRRHAAALLRDLAAELGEPAAGADSPEDEPEPDGPRASLHRVEHATCRNCGYPVYRVMRDGQDVVPWSHADSADVPPAGPRWTLPVGVLYGRGGCRAASFDRLGEWDDSLGRSWMAEPAPGTIR